jgi:hypothetical protein
MREKLRNVDRKFGNVAIVDVRVDHGNDFERVDYGLIRVFDTRAAHNRLSKIHAFRLFDFVGDGDKLSMPLMRANVGETVLKNGIRTGLTYGTVIDPVLINWESEMEGEPTKADQRKSKCDAVLGREIGVQKWHTFADEGDSGSALLRFVKKPSDTSPDSARIISSELVGIIYGIVFEEERDCFVATFMPTDRIFHHIHNSLGMNMDLNVEDSPESDWPHEEIGRGLSTFDLH